MARKAGLASGVEVAKITVRVSPDTKEFRRELKADLDEIENSLKAKIAIEPDMGDFREEVKAKTEGMKAKVKVDADVDKGFFSNIAKKLENIDPPSFGSGINPTAGALIGVAALSVAAPLIGLISAALLALPGVISLIAAPIAAITVGLDGIKNAAKVLETPFKNLQAVMSKVNEAAFTPVFEKLKDIFPALETSMPAVSQGLAQVAKSIVDAVTSGPGLELIKGSFTNIGNALGRVNLGGFTDGLLKLVNSFSGGPLDGLTSWLSKTSDSFGNWITKITTADASGVSPFTQAMDGLGGSLKIVLDTVTDLGKKGFEFISKPENMEGFKNDLQFISDTLSNIMDLSAKIASFKMPDWINQDPKAPNANNRNSEDGQAWWQNFGAFPGVNPEPLSKGQQSFFESLFGVPPEKSGADDGSKYGDSLLGKLREGLSDNGLKGTGDGAGNIFQVPDLEPLKAKWAELKSFVTSNPLFQGPATGGGSGDANSIFQVPDFGPIKQAWQDVKNFFTDNPLQMPDFSAALQVPDFGPLKEGVRNAWEDAKSATSEGVNAIVSFAQGLPGQISGALGSLGGLLVSAGKAAMDGLLSGIKAGAEAVYNFVSGIAAKIAALKGPLPYDRKVLIPNGEALMTGLGKGLENGFEPVLNQAKDMAGQVAAAFAAGNVDPTQALAGFSPDEVKRLEKVLTLETKRLEIQAKALDYQGKLNKDDGLKAQAKALRDQKDQLSLQKDMLDTAKEFSDTGDDSKGDVLTKAVGNLMSSPVNFAKATGKQFLSDIGISGDGVIGKALTEGVKYIFQIGSVDEALSIKDRTESKEKLAITGRGGV